MIREDKALSRDKGRFPSRWPGLVEFTPSSESGSDAMSLTKLNQVLWWRAAGEDARTGHYRDGGANGLAVFRLTRCSALQTASILQNSIIVGLSFMPK